jgi:hypothetical protein
MSSLLQRQVNHLPQQQWKGQQQQQKGQQQQRKGQQCQQVNQSTFDILPHKMMQQSSLFNHFNPSSQSRLALQANSLPVLNESSLENQSSADIEPDPDVAHGWFFLNSHLITELDSSPLRYIFSQYDQVGTGFDEAISDLKVIYEINKDHLAYHLHDGHLRVILRESNQTMRDTPLNDEILSSIQKCIHELIDSEVGYQWCSEFGDGNVEVDDISMDWIAPQENKCFIFDQNQGFDCHSDMIAISGCLILPFDDVLHIKLPSKDAWCSNDLHVVEKGTAIWCNDGVPFTVEESTPQGSRLIRIHFVKRVSVRHATICVPKGARINAMAEHFAYVLSLCGLDAVVEEVDDFIPQDQCRESKVIRFPEYIGIRVYLYAQTRRDFMLYNNTDLFIFPPPRVVETLKWDIIQEFCLSFWNGRIANVAQWKDKLDFYKKDMVGSANFDVHVVGGKVNSYFAPSDSGPFTCFCSASKTNPFLSLESVNIIHDENYPFLSTFMANGHGDLGKIQVSYNCGSLMSTIDSFFSHLMDQFEKSYLPSKYITCSSVWETTIYFCRDGEWRLCLNQVKLFPSLIPSLSPSGTSVDYNPIFKNPLICGLLEYVSYRICSCRGWSLCYSHPQPNIELGPPLTLEGFCGLLNCNDWLGLGQTRYSSCLPDGSSAVMPAGGGTMDQMVEKSHMSGSRSTADEKRDESSSVSGKSVGHQVLTGKSDDTAVGFQGSRSGGKITPDGCRVDKTVNAVGRKNSSRKSADACSSIATMINQCSSSINSDRNVSRVSSRRQRVSWSLKSPKSSGGTDLNEEMIRSSSSSTPDSCFGNVPSKTSEKHVVSTEKMKCTPPSRGASLSPDEEKEECRGSSVLGDTNPTRGQVLPCAAGSKCVLGNGTSPRGAESHHRCPGCNGHIHALCGVPTSDPTLKDDLIRHRTCFSCAGRSDKGEVVPQGSSASTPESCFGNVTSMSSKKNIVSTEKRKRIPPLRGASLATSALRSSNKMTPVISSQSKNPFRRKSSKDSSEKSDRNGQKSRSQGPGIDIPAACASKRRRMNERLGHKL